MCKCYKLLATIYILLFCFTSSNAQLYINEWMAINDNVIADNVGEYDDWIEIYNAGNTAIDLAGYYFSDDVNNQTLWQIPNSNPGLTTIPPNGFILFWADNETTQGANHLPFKINSSNDVIILTEPDGITISNQVLSIQQNSNVSYGRISDGSSNFQFFANATPAASNNISSGSLTYNALFDIPVLESSDDAEEPFGQNFTVLDEQILNIVNDWSGDQTVGLRFQNIPLPAGTTINKAYIQFTSAFPTASVGACDLNIHSENNNNSNTFSTAAQDISNRAMSTAVVNWQPEEWSVLNQAGPLEQTPDLSTLVQEVVDLAAWSEGNALSFIFTGTGVRIPFSADNPDQNLVPRLHLEGELTAPETLVESLFINEVAAQGTDYADEAGECDDWIELYNGGTTATTIGGLFLTDDLDDLTKWQIASPSPIPPGGFVTIWMDNDPEQGGLHANFKLGGTGEELALVQWINNEFVILDELTFGEIPFKASYGRTTDGGSTWNTFGEISPNESNNNVLPWQSPPTIDLASGGYFGVQTINLSHSDPTAIIYYTTDGSEPDINAILYTGPFTISENTSLNAKAFTTGFLESKSAKASYLIDENLSIPSLFINTDPANFFDTTTGIYVEGTNGIVDYCTTFPANWNQEWEIPVNLSMINGDGSTAFQVEAGAKIGGGCSRMFDMKSLNISTRESKYGDKKIDYPLFAGRDHQNYKRIKLRNSGQDYLRMGFRDGLLHTLLWDKVDVELHAFQPSVLYINGDFWGLHNIRELYTDEYFEAIYGIKKDEIDIIKNPNLDWEEIKQGDNLDYLEMYNFFESNNLALPSIYSQAETMLDMNEFTNYWVSMIYTANADWPANNIIVWKEKAAGAKWRYAVMDKDGSTGNVLTSETAADYNTLEAVTDPNSVNWPNHQNSTLVFRKLLENEAFRNEYIQRSCSFIHLVYGSERVNSYTDSIQTMYEPYVTDHITKWEADNALGGSYANWQSWVTAFKDFFVDRPDFMRGFINQSFSLDQTYELLLNYNENTGGVVNVNTNEMETPFNYTGQYFKGIPLRVTAVPKPNYEFAYWLETGGTDPVLDFVSTEDATLTPIFQVAINIGADTSLCQGSTLVLDAMVPGCNCDYLWSDGSQNPTLEITAGTITSYSVTVTDAIGVPSVDEVTIAVNALPSALASPTAVLCPGGADGSINLDVSGGAGTYAFSWSDGSNLEDLSNVSAGMFTVTVSDEYNCETIVENIIVGSPEDFSLLTNETSTTCPGATDGAVDLSVTGGTAPYSYLWSTNNNSQDLINLAAGTYGVTITDAVSCQMATIAEVEEPLPIEATVNTTLPEPGANDGSIHIDPLGGTAPYTFLWFNGETTSMINNLPFGIYSVTITDTNGCTHQEVIEFFPLAWTEPKDLLSFVLLPNPAHNICQVNLELQQRKSFQFALYDATGVLILQSVHEGQEVSIPLNVSTLPTGVYFVELVIDAGRAYRRLVVK